MWTSRKNKLMAMAGELVQGDRAGPGGQEVCAQSLVNGLRVVHPGQVDFLCCMCVCSGVLDC